MTAGAFGLFQHEVVEVGQQRKRQPARARPESAQLVIREGCSPAVFGTVTHGDNRARNIRWARSETFDVSA